MKFNFEVLNKYRLRDGNYGSNPDDTFGAFYLPYQSFVLKVLASDGIGFTPQWEHVSVSLPNRCPNWKEMCFIKDLFWDKEETVIQLHPPKSLYINNHPNCLHLWKPVGIEITLPPPILVGVKTKGAIKES